MKVCCIIGLQIIPPSAQQQLLSAAGIPTGIKDRPPGQRSGAQAKKQEDKKMPVVEELIRAEQDGTISFGNYTLGQKAKKSDFEYEGDIYKVKTFYEITKLERNDMFVYESVPGTVAEHFKVSDEGVEFLVEGAKDAQITVQLEDDTNYEVYVDGAAVGSMKTNMSGKLSVSVELEEGTAVTVKAVKRV